MLEHVSLEERDQRTRPIRGGTSPEQRNISGQATGEREEHYWEEKTQEGRDTELVFAWAERQNEKTLPFELRRPLRDQAFLIRMFPEITGNTMRLLEKYSVDEIHYLHIFVKKSLTEIAELTGLDCTAMDIVCACLFKDMTYEELKEKFGIWDVYTYFVKTGEDILKWLQLKRSVEDIRKLNKKFAGLTLDILTQIDRFSIEEVEELMRICGNSWETVGGLGKTGWTVQEIKDLLALPGCPVPAVLARMKALSYKTLKGLYETPRQYGRLEAKRIRNPWDEILRLEPVAERVEVAYRVTEEVRALIPEGPENQAWAIQKLQAEGKSGTEGNRNMRVMGQIFNEKLWQGKKPDETFHYPENWMKTKRVGKAVAATGGGNCQDIASLAYNFLRDRCQGRWTVCLILNTTASHVFATIGDPWKEPLKKVVVVDAWVRYPRPVTMDIHFCGNISNCKRIQKEREHKPRRVQELMNFREQVRGDVEKKKRVTSGYKRTEAYHNDYPEGEV